MFGFDDMHVALGEAVYACNADINESGASPFQAAVGRQPRMVGDVLGGIQNRLAEHGLVSSKPSLARQTAMPETAKVSMCRLHFSRGLRKAELARSRSTTIEEAPAPGTVCYFYRPLRYNRKGAGSRKKLTLKRWHGPALLVALEGHASAFLSYKGQLTKCALEHVRVASTMEQIAAETWREAIDEVVEAARQDAARQEPEEAPVGDAESLPAGENPRTPAFLPSTPAPAALQPASADGGADLPPLQPQELVGAMLSLGDEGGNGLGSVPGSRRMSDVSSRAAASSIPGSRRMSDVSSRAAASSIPPLPRPLPLSQSIERAQRLDAAAGVKRPAEIGASDYKDTQDVADGGAASAVEPSRVADALLVSKEDIFASLGDPSVHPLVHIHNGACLDRLRPLESCVNDHGSWHGRWHLPSQSEWETRSKLGLSWPIGSDDVEDSHEACAVQAARKEYFWKSMTDEQKKFKEAATQAWSVWAENDALQILSDEEAARVRQKLKQNRESDSKILTPRYVFTDKHEALRTPTNP